MVSKLTTLVHFQRFLLVETSLNSNFRLLEPQRPQELSRLRSLPLPHKFKCDGGTSSSRRLVEGVFSWLMDLLLFMILFPRPQLAGEHLIRAKHGRCTAFHRCM